MPTHPTMLDLADVARLDGLIAPIPGHCPCGIPLDSPDEFCVRCAPRCTDCSCYFDLVTTSDTFGRCPDCSHVCYACDDVIEGELTSFDHCPDCVVECRHCCAEVESTDNLDGYNRCGQCSITCDDCGCAMQAHGDFDRCITCQVYCSFDDCEERVSHAGTYCDYHAQETYSGSDEEDEESGSIHSHSYSPPSYLYEGQRPYFGVEIEMETPDDEFAIRREIVGIVPRPWYCKEDGSLRFGVEAVSMPRSWEAWRADKLEWMSKAANRGAKSYHTTTCGIHVHLDRKLYSKLTIAKVLKFFGTNTKLIERLSGRQDDKLEQWAHIYVPSSRRIDRAYIAFVSSPPSAHEKYSAINLRHPRTIEIRIFRGNLEAERVKEHIALVYAIFAWASVTSMRMAGRLSSFYYWLDSLRARQLIGEKTVKALLNNVRKARGYNVPDNPNV